MKNIKSNTQIVEVKSAMNDNVVVSFEVDASRNIFTEGFSKICGMLNINRVEAEQRYYVERAR